VNSADRCEPNAIESSSGRADEFPRLAASSRAANPRGQSFCLPTGWLRSNFVAAALGEMEDHAHWDGNRGNVGLMHSQKKLCTAELGVCPKPKDLREEERQ
jgi:hypothetical protein